MKRGFSLIELMVASLLLSMIVVLLSTMMNQSAISWRAGSASVLALGTAQQKNENHQVDAANQQPRRQGRQIGPGGGMPRGRGFRRARPQVRHGRRHLVVDGRRGGMSRRRGFTLLELLTVIAMLTVLTGALSSAVASARRRTRIVRADAEVHEISNAILAYENISENKSLNGHAMSDQEATEKNLGFILGDGGKTAGGEKIPVLFNGAVSSDGTSPLSKTTLSPSFTATRKDD